MDKYRYVLGALLTICFISSQISDKLYKSTKSVCIYMQVHHFVNKKINKNLQDLTNFSHKHTKIDM